MPVKLETHLDLAQAMHALGFVKTPATTYRALPHQPSWCLCLVGELSASRPRRPWKCRKPTSCPISVSTTTFSITATIRPLDEHREHRDRRESVGEAGFEPAT